MLRPIAIGLVLLSLGALLATVQNFQNGLAAAKLRYYGTAREWRPLAEQGHAKAQYRLGLSYTKGHGVSKDDAEAVKWYRKAANQGHAHGQYSLGLMYFKGLGVTQNFILAYMWFGLSAASGLKYGPSGQDRAAWHMNPAQIAEAQRLARQWLDKHKKK